VDVAFWAEELEGAWGFVIRDHQANAVLAGAGRLALVSDALYTESHACIEALQIAANRGMHRVIVETDSQILVKALRSDEMDRAPSGVLLREAKFIMATLFSSVEVLHVPRSCNSVAHGLAQVGRGREA
jgi:ribonuclease HI